MEQALELAASNPDTVKLLFNYAWILIPVLGTCAALCVRVLLCCLPGTAGGMMGGSPIPGSLCSCCPTVNSSGGGASPSERRDIETGLVVRASSSVVSTGKFDNVGPDGSERRKRTRACSLLCCFCYVVIMLGTLAFVGIYPFLKWTVEQQE